MWAESKRPTSCFHIAGRRCVHLFLYRNDSFSVCGVVCVVASALASCAVRLFPVRRERNGQLLLPTRRALHWLCFVSESASSSSSVSVTPPLSFFESCCELFLLRWRKKKKNSVRWFWQRWCNCAGEILEVDCCEQCERLSLLTHARERTLTGRKGKKEKKNAQSQESLLTVFSLCADYVPLFLFFLEFSNIWDPFWQVVFLFFFLYFWWTSRDSVVWCCGEMPRCTSANCVTRWLLLTLQWLRCVPGWCGQKGMLCTMFTYQVLVYAWNYEKDLSMRTRFWGEMNFSGWNQAIQAQYSRVFHFHRLKANAYSLHQKLLLTGLELYCLL